MKKNIKLLTALFGFMVLNNASYAMEEICSEDEIYEVMTYNVTNVSLSNDAVENRILKVTSNHNYTRYDYRMQYLQILLSEAQKEYDSIFFSNEDFDSKCNLFSMIHSKNVFLRIGVEASMNQYQSLKYPQTRSLLKKDKKYREQKTDSLYMAHDLYLRKNFDESKKILSGLMASYRNEIEILQIKKELELFYRSCPFYTLEQQLKTLKSFREEMYYTHNDEEMSFFMKSINEKKYNSIRSYLQDCYDNSCNAQNKHEKIIRMLNHYIVGLEDQINTSKNLYIDYVKYIQNMKTMLNETSDISEIREKSQEFYNMWRTKVKLLKDNSDDNSIDENQFIDKLKREFEEIITKLLTNGLDAEYLNSIIKNEKQAIEQLREEKNTYKQFNKERIKRARYIRYKEYKLTLLEEILKSKCLNMLGDIQKKFQKYLNEYSQKI